MELTTLTVKELIAELQNYDGDLPVVSCCNYGDRSRTMQAIAVSELHDQGYLQTSGYSDSGYKVVDDGDQDDDDVQVVVLNYDAL